MKRQEFKNLLRGIKPDGDISDIVERISIYLSDVRHIPRAKKYEPL